MSAMQRPPGFYGKLPAVGDFVHRRLPETFVDPWHVAMQGLLSAAAATITTPEQHAPVWRFVLMPGLAGTAAWVGAMRASVDRVDRVFPLVIAAPLSASDADGTTAAVVPTDLYLPSWLDAADAVLCNIGAERQQDGAWLERACVALAQHAHDDASVLAVPLVAGATTAGSSLWWTAMTGSAPGAWMRIAGWPAACHAPVLLGPLHAPSACRAEALP
ncbi:type VI secretion system-associated protein TagF [Xanthomonas prunicola]|uniref:Type VI secretion system-associated protein TagF n=1 Tax=Xanthomonas prunicola TaxID=2053930 RepID=A0A9Q9MXB1_9XANT|nr:type VI secretion system-associated protein TagF [Xanthomonas prunicola]USJ00427.1 type VI secretion system-associated protein TagF [Xanthomonas prunicola]UXA48978.1 type VI secretion system-associated protein TagF [Xanthomonas prunicola]UXA57282.1 type VI secretion system-associated protein TagF [Xanthomonas prunicola]UXA63234.1 type VI secretion system-associated protein TagF [Xanthomonas prunicola]UXA65445.1 type VI secretion system-associated protein TagF [Xanthomonas prunicola]